MAYILYSGDDEQLRAEIYPQMEARTQLITVGGFADEKAFSTSPLPSAMIKHMSEKGHLTRDPHERPSQMVGASSVEIGEAIMWGTRIVGAVLQWIQTNPGFVDWIRNGLDFWRLDQYDLVVYRVKNKGVFMDFKLVRPR